MVALSVTDPSSAGLAHICQTYDRFSHVAITLGNMVINLEKEKSARLLKHVIRCYLRLSDNSRSAPTVLIGDGVDDGISGSPFLLISTPN